MEFHVNSPILFVIVGVVILAVLGQSVYFLVRAWRRANELGMDKTKLKKTVTTAAIFTIAPAVAILVGVISLSHSLGVALPWLRLSVVGSLSYEPVPRWRLWAWGWRPKSPIPPPLSPCCGS